MSQSDNRVLSSGRGFRSFQRLIWVIVLILVVCGVCFLPSQMTNSLTLVNDSSAPMWIGQVTVGRYVESTAPSSLHDLLNPTTLIVDHVMQPNTKLTLPLGGARRGRVLAVTISSSKEAQWSRSYRTSASWGFHWTIGFNAKNEMIMDGDASSLRRLFTSISPWLPLPTSWRE